MPKKLVTQLSVIRDLMLDGQWRSLGTLSALTGYPQASISAQLRHLRKPAHGLYIVEKRAANIPNHGIKFEYQLTPNNRANQGE